MVEVQLCESDPVPTALLITFAICTTLLVSVHMLALMISTCILPVSLMFLGTCHQVKLAARRESCRSNEKLRNRNILLDNT